MTCNIKKEKHACLTYKNHEKFEMKNQNNIVLYRRLCGVYLHIQCQEFGGRREIVNIEWGFLDSRFIWT